ncbi:Transcription factor HES-2 [Tupaia chinensis]|uniref:Transcription factor HES-2 n=1 Tax=Tupaia chinensis TaxID=246437 RepID=L9L1S1_TUPCH|nr:Transcription factor HES-2 [Tupaia chinensis]
MGLPRRAGDTAELRKSLKPLLEKRRRERINESLSQLKGLILPLLPRRWADSVHCGGVGWGGRGEERPCGPERGLTALCASAGGTGEGFNATPKSSPSGNSRYSKLEKADILEMTVRFLQELPASSCPDAAPAPSDSYREGYHACLGGLARVLPACRVLEPSVSARLLEYLRRRAAGASPDRGSAGDYSPRPPPAPRRPGLRPPAVLASGGPGSLLAGLRTLLTANLEPGAPGRPRKLVTAPFPTMRNQPSTHA